MADDDTVEHAAIFVEIPKCPGCGTKGAVKVTSAPKWSLAEDGSYRVKYGKCQVCSLNCKIVEAW